MPGTSGSKGLVTTLGVLGIIFTVPQGKIRECPSQTQQCLCVYMYLENNSSWRFFHHSVQFFENTMICEISAEVTFSVFSKNRISRELCISSDLFSFFGRLVHAEPRKNKLSEISPCGEISELTIEHHDLRCVLVRSIFQNLKFHCS